MEKFVCSLARDTAAHLKGIELDAAKIGDPCEAIGCTGKLEAAPAAVEKPEPAGRTGSRGHRDEDVDIDLLEPGRTRRRRGPSRGQIAALAMLALVGGGVWYFNRPSSGKPTGATKAPPTPPVAPPATTAATPDLLPGASPAPTPTAGGDVKLSCRYDATATFVCVGLPGDPTEVVEWAPAAQQPAPPKAKAILVLEIGGKAAYRAVNPLEIEYGKAGDVGTVTFVAVK